MSNPEGNLGEPPRARGFRVRVFTYSWPSAAWSVRISGALKEAAWEPAGLVATLKAQGRNLHIRSPATVEWLDETQLTPPLLPAEALNRTRVCVRCLDGGLVDPGLVPPPPQSAGGGSGPLHDARHEFPTIGVSSR